MKNLFSILPEGALRTSELARGDLVFLQGDRIRDMFAVTAGCIQLQRHTEAGAKVVIHTACAGETFAEASLYSDTYHCDAVALEPSRVVRIERTIITDLIARKPEFATAIIAQFAQQIQNQRARIAVMSIRSAKERVFAAMAEGMLDTDIKAFATTIGLTHETVYRALSSLVSDHRIKKIGRGRYAHPQAGKKK